MYFNTTQEDKAELDACLAGLAKGGSVIGVTSGCFDMIHPLHIQYLQKCASKCQRLIVGVDSDDLLFKTKKKMPVISEFDRAFIVSSLGVVDYTFIMDSLDDLKDVLSTIRRTSAQASIQLYKAQTTYYGSPVLEIPNVELVFIPDVYPASSTTELVQYIQNHYQKL